jgi:hypothetical protein
MFKIYTAQGRYWIAHRDDKTNEIKAFDTYEDACKTYLSMLRDGTLKEAYAKVRRGFAYEPDRVGADCSMTREEFLEVSDASNFIFGRSVSKKVRGQFCGAVARSESMMKTYFPGFSFTGTYSVAVRRVQAHGWYAPGINEIGFRTKIAFGCLAHEWGHAWQSRFAMDAVRLSTLMSMPFAQRCKGDRYYGDWREVVARSLESVTLHLMHLRGEKNDFLSDASENEARCVLPEVIVMRPWPDASEFAEIRLLWKEVFDTAAVAV